MFPSEGINAYTLEVIEIPGESTLLALWQFDMQSDWSNAIYIDLADPHIGYTVEQVKKMADYFAEELIEGQQRGTYWFASGICSIL